MSPHTICSLPLLASAVLFGGCSSYSLSTPQTPPVDAFGPARTDVATVCVIRPSHWAVAVTFVVHDDEQLVGATRGESYFCYFAQPGEHSILSSTGDPTDRDGRATLTAGAGRRYWLLQSYDNVFGSITDKLAWVDEASARQLLEDGACDYRVLDGVPSEEKLSGPVPIAPALAAR
jgi:hypothetical protein